MRAGRLVGRRTVPVISANRIRPHPGVRGIDAYGETWPPFFEWQAQGALFEIVSLDVTAGGDVAYAHALLRCGTPQELAE